MCSLKLSTLVLVVIIVITNATKELNYTYDVYLSYRRTDIRDDFLRSFNGALLRKDLTIFMDDKLEREQVISRMRVKIMEESRIIIVFITENYASSSWRLEELVMMLELMKVKNQKVCPVFYEVDPSDVRHQRRSFGEAMAKHEDRFGRDSEKVQKWREALFQVTNLTVLWHFQYEGKRYEDDEFVQKIVDWVSHSLFSYDVFLSFRGKDTRYSFTGFLSNVLRQEGFKTFIDDEGWVDGNQVSQFHIQAIEDSKFLIIVFSENYANSPYCLDALVKILERKKFKTQQVFPIFYKVLPSDVRHQSSHYREAMDAHERRLGNESEKVQKWRSALSEVASLKGWHLKSTNIKLSKGLWDWSTKPCPDMMFSSVLEVETRDTRYTFTGYLYYALCKKGVKTFMDDDALEGGAKISDTIINAIEESRISIIVFSENYASSSWCLDELVHILECKRMKNHLVWPIYYKVEPSDVWNQRNSYGRDMAIHENKWGKESEKVQKWRSALTEVASLRKWLPFRTGCYEHELIDEIVEKIGRI